MACSRDCRCSELANAMTDSFLNLTCPFHPLFHDRASPLNPSDFACSIPGCDWQVTYGSILGKILTFCHGIKDEFLPRGFHISPSSSFLGDSFPGWRSTHVPKTTSSVVICSFSPMRSSIGQCSIIGLAADYSQSSLILNKYMARNWMLLFVKRY